MNSNMDQSNFEYEHFLGSEVQILVNWIHLIAETIP